MEMRKKRSGTGGAWLAACAALAAGEFAASLAPQCAPAWPAFAVLAALAALFGFGLAVPRWHLVFLFLLGAAVFNCSAADREREYRGRPWLREARARRRVASAPPASAQVRRGFARRAAIGLEHNPEAAALNLAILLGDRSRIPRSAKRAFVGSGTMHVFAISGLHVMAVARILCLMLRIAFVPRRLAGAAAVPLLWGYVWVAGLPPSAVRAALMATFYCAAPLFWRKPDGMAAWGAAFFIVYLKDPAMISNVGCGLSFAVMLAILLTLDSGILGRGAVRQTLGVSLAAWAAGAPIAAHAFGRLTPGGLAANLALLPSAAVTVTAGVLGMAASFVSEQAAAHLNNLSALFTGAMVRVSEAVSSLPGANFETGRWPLWGCAAWYAAMAALAAAAYRRRRRVSSDPWP